MDSTCNIFVTYIILLNRTGELELGVFGSLEPEPIEEKKLGAGATWKKKSGAGAAKKLAGS